METLWLLKITIHFSSLDSQIHDRVTFKLFKQGFKLAFRENILPVLSHQGENIKICH